MTETYRPNSWNGIWPPQNNKCGLCLILDQDYLPADAEAVMAAALSAGVSFFQYRSKGGSRKSIYEVSLRLSRLASETHTVFVVNDHADIAAAVDADGVHLGQDDLPIAHARTLLGKSKLIGISTHTVAQAREAQLNGADYIGFGPMFTTATKDAGPVQGLENLSLVRKAISMPIVAIGGINHTNIADVIRHGADGAAVISAVLSSPDIKIASSELLSIVDREYSTPQ